MTIFGIALDSGFSGAVESDGDPARLIADAQEADRAGLDIVTVSDHPYHAGQLDAYATLGFVLGATTGVSGAVTVTNLPVRPAPALARTVSALSTLSGGRIKLGVGAGVFWDRIEAFGAERRTPAEAVRLLAESITLIRALTGGGEPMTFDGEFHHVTDLAPAAAPTPPIWTGSIGPASLAVTGRLADGWVPAAAQDWRSDLIARSRPVIDRAAAEAGRDPSAIATIYNVFGAISADSAPITRSTGEFGIAQLAGSVQSWIDELVVAVQEHDAAGFVFFPVVGTAAEKEASRQRWLHEVVPAVRAATKRD
ncbi:LLM class flavin-dependent oxidoreductase [Amycolatopsis jejuensis]|uniref:LLM class flavin-dependent oxidoreductase n=1 Tax=Amycolatopsis jejuensis TaxID=330084 RepID=UPI000527151F|nr:LLM class flavin-dependent oxidoreductase [Amycolatopsis jejuensis]